MVSTGRVKLAKVMPSMALVAVPLNHRSPTAEEAKTATLDYESMAEQLMGLGRLDEAEETLRRALGIYAVSLDDDHQYIASALTELGAVLVSRGEAGDAVPLLTEALRIRRLDYPDDNVLTAATKLEFGSALLETGRTADAQDLILDAAGILQGRNDRRAQRAIAAVARLENATTEP